MLGQNVFLWAKWCGAVLLVATLAGCDLFGPAKAPGDIPVAFKDLSQGSQCRSQIKMNNEWWQVDYLAFYVSEPRIKIGDHWQELSFLPNEWQSKTAALLKFHDTCDDSQANSVIRLDANEQLLNRASVIRFTVGLPFDQNHLTGDGLAPPVNNPAMFQSPQAGHTFMRIELKQAGKDDPGLYSFLLASGQCDAPDAQSAPSVCAKPNRITLDLPLKANVADLRLSAQLRKILFRAQLVPGLECNLADAPDKRCNKVLRNLTRNEWIRWDAPHQVYLKQD